MFRSSPYDLPPPGNVPLPRGGYPFDQPSPFAEPFDARRPTTPPNQPSPGPPTVPEEFVPEAFVSRTIYLCRLPIETTEETLRGMCEPYGELRKVAYYGNRQIAFIEFWDIRCAEKARMALKDAKVFGKPIEVQYSRVRDDRRSGDNNTGTLYVRPVTTERNFRDPNLGDSYKELFSQFGEVKKVNPNRKREAEKFIEYYDLRAAEAALSLNGFNLNGVVLEVQFANHVSKTLNREPRPPSETRRSRAPVNSTRGNSNDFCNYNPPEGPTRLPHILEPPQCSAVKTLTPVAPNLTDPYAYTPPVWGHQTLDRKRRTINLTFNGTALRTSGATAVYSIPR